ncbi:MAG: hypothetical protein KQI62_02245 [Deltaproteobacteria bacterium]|nr:hypothetical protein [Deltaproteobacteria bacterium]
MPDSVRLAIGGADYDGWKSLSISLSLSQFAGGFELTTTDRYPGHPEKYNFRMGQACTVSVRGQTVITGYLEDIKPSYDKGSHGITLSGRDATCDLVDCSHVGPPSQWARQSLLQICREVCSPFGIAVKAETALGEVFESVRTNEGDTVSAFIVRLCRQRGVLPLTYGDGALVLSKAGARGRGGSLVLGDNLKRGSAAQSNRERFSRYIVKAQGQRAALPADPLTEAEAQLFRQTYTSPVAESLDTVISRYRPLVVLAETKGTQADCQARANWEAGVRAGRSRSATYTVQGWGPDNGGLWQVNTTVPVTDALLGASGEWLVEGLVFSMDPQDGTLTELQLVPPDAYLPQPNVAAAIGGFD